MKTLTWVAPLGLGLALVLTTSRSVDASAAAVHFDLEQHLETLIAEYETVEDAYYDELMAADNATRIRLIAEHPWKEHMPRFLEVVELGAGTDIAARALLEIFSKGMAHTPDEAWFAFDVLVNDHIGSERLARLAAFARDSGDARARDGLRRIAAESPHESARAAAHFNLAMLLMSDEETRAEARENLEAVISKYGDVPSPRGVGYGELASSSLYELVHLQVGQVAPDFASTDETGVDFKLSEYRGKVVLVDFWGFW